MSIISGTATRAKASYNQEPQCAELIFTLDSSDYRRSQQLLAAVSGRHLDQALQPPQKRTASCVQLCIAVQKLDLLGRNRSL
ncbi:hypothetical protein [Microcoleus sp. B9-D4]|uniref:hypothetical protein n=1 Tax=Microcoleus sp. B9-D4 TaxID=2818711 RepID=UPI002FD56D04